MGDRLQLHGDALYLNYCRLQSLPLLLFEDEIAGILRRLHLKQNLLSTLVKTIC
jgi:hypothetical protein